MTNQSFSLIHPGQIQHVSGFLGQRFEVNHTNRLKDPILSEEFIRRHERKDHFEWFWAGEQIGKWFDASAYTALITRDTWLLNRIEELLERLSKTQEEDGAVSITLRRNRIPARGMELYEYYYVLHGLLVLHDLLKSDKALNMAVRLGEYIIKTWGPEPGQFPLAGRFPGNGHGGGEGTLILEPIVMLGLRSGQSRFIEWGERTLRKWDEWLELYPESYFSCGYTEMKRFASGEKDVYELRKGIHAHTYHMTLLGVAALYNATGSAEYRDTILGSIDRIASEWIFLTGGMSSNEGYVPRRYYNPRGDIEVCPQHTWILMLAQAYQWTGQAQYLAEIERDLFNHLLAAQLSDGTNWSYMTPLAGQSQEPEKPNCCNGSGQRIAGRMPTYLYGLRNGEPAVLMYTQSQAHYDTPGVTIRQETDFPASGEVKLHIHPDQPARFTLHLRIPPYVQGASMQVNGETEAAVTPGTFAVVEREWHSDDTIQLHLPFSITAQANEHGSALVRGPLVYGYFQKAQPDPVVFAGRRGVFPEDVVMHLNPRQPSVQETPAPTGMLGPALLVPGHIKPQVPMFAQEAGNDQLEAQREVQLLLLPFANQGAVRGDYQVFLNYQRM